MDVHVEFCDKIILNFDPLDVGTDLVFLYFCNPQKIFLTGIGLM